MCLVAKEMDNLHGDPDPLVLGKLKLVLGRLQLLQTAYVGLSWRLEGLSLGLEGVTEGLGSVGLDPGRGLLYAIYATEV